MDAIADGFAHVEGTVMAICKRGYVLADDSGAVLAYYGSAFKPENYKLGDKIGIVDEFGAYNFGLQFSCDGKDGFVLEDKLKEVAAMLTEKYGVEALPIRCDITDTEADKAAVKKVLEHIETILQSLQDG